MAGRPTRRDKAGKAPGERAKEQRAQLMAELHAELPKAAGEDNPIAEAYALRKKAYVSRLQEAAEEVRQARQQGPETEDAVEECIAMVAEGHSLREAARALGYNYSRINMALYRDKQKDGRMTQALQHAREHYAHERQRLMHEIIAAEPDPQRARLIADCIKWELSKVLPKFYGDKITAEAGEGVTFSINLGASQSKG